MPADYPNAACSPAWRPEKNAIRLARLAEGLRPFQRPRVAACRRVRIAPEVQVHRGTDGHLCLHGLVTCGSVHNCPICSSKISAKRSTEVQFAAETWRSLGGTVSMLTLTVRHSFRDDLEGLRRGVAHAYRLLMQGTRGGRLKAALGLHHSIRALEVTHGANGWHPHLHVLLFRSGNGYPEAIAADDVKEAWKDCVRRALGPAYIPDDEHGVTLKDSRRDDYLAKMGLEAGNVSRKEGRNGSRSVWQIAEDAVSGDERSRKLWVAYGSAMLGARQLTWSRGARRFFLLRDEDDDGTLAQDEVGSCVAVWTASTWDSLRSRSGWLSSVMAALSSDSPLSELAKLNCDGKPRNGVARAAMSSAQEDVALRHIASTSAEETSPILRRTAVTLFSEASRVWFAIERRHVANLWYARMSELSGET